MKVSNMVKANLITQLILAAVAFVIFFFIGFFTARDEKKKKNKEVETVYNDYITKEMQYGQP
jgi:uncharacterized protein YneF (UPF0154 family)